MRTIVSPEGQLRFAFTSAEQRRLREAVALVGGVAGAIGDTELAGAAAKIRARLLDSDELLGQAATSDPQPDTND